jgi:hypothetical protein
MEVKGYTQGNIVILTKPLPVPDGTEVEVFVPSKTQSQGPRGRKQAKVALETFGLIPADPALVQTVLAEDLYES